MLQGLIVLALIFFIVAFVPVYISDKYSEFVNKYLGGMQVFILSYLGIITTAITIFLITV